MKLAQDDATRICTRIVDHGMDTGLVAKQFEISRRRVQQLVKEYRETDEVPQLETSGRKPYADYPADLEERVLDLRQRRGTKSRSAITTAGEHDFDLHYVEDTAADPEEDAYFRPIEDSIAFDS